jgi:hypothetical protein
MIRQLVYPLALCTVAFALTAVPVGAGPIDLTNISGTWQNPVGGSNVTGEGTPAITWGDGVIPDSGYLFDPGADILGAAVDVPLLLGTFTHYNEEIPLPTLTSVDLDFGFDTNGVPGSAGGVFTFDHNETPNLTGTSPADDDIVTITMPIVNIPITVGGDVYFFNLLGFSVDGGTSFENVFSSVEGGHNSALLYGQLTKNPVPEPASLVLFGGALTAVAIRLRRTRRPASARG